jgi:hypothetical protein
VSAAAAGMAAVFAAGRAGWQHVLFVVLVVVASVSLVILLAAGVQGLVAWFRQLRRRGAAGAPLLPSPSAPPSSAPNSALRASSALASPVLASGDVATQENEVVGSGTLFGVLGGELVVHGDDADQSPVTSAQSLADPVMPNPGRIQRNVVRDNGQLFAVTDGNLHLHRLPGQQPPEPTPREEKGPDGRV